MIKQQTTQEKPVFGVDFKTKRKQVQKIEKPVVSPTPKKLCTFQVLKEIRSQGPSVYIMGSSQCQYEALSNGWCEMHNHAQAGMDEGERLGYRSVEIPLVYYGEGREPFMLIIGQGRLQWEAYFERATGSGLAKVMDYLSKQ